MAQVIIVHGPPNAGKSSQSHALAEKRGFAYISSGDQLRKSDDPVIVARLASGVLARSEDVMRIMKRAIEQLPADQPVVLDGFPRMLNEFHDLERWFEPQGRVITDVVEIALTQEESHARSSQRGRHDDHKTEERWHWYLTETTKVLDYCREKGWLRVVDGNGSREEVAERLEAAV